MPSSGLYQTSIMKLFDQLLLVTALVRAQDINFISDPGVYGPTLEVEHAYFGQWPTGVAVSSTGRKFSNFPGGMIYQLHIAFTIFKFEQVWILRMSTMARTRSLPLQS